MLLFAYVIQRRADLGCSRLLDDGLRRAQRGLANRMPALAEGGWPQLLLLAGLPTLVLMLALWLVHGWLFGVPAMFLELMVLFLVLGYPSQKQELGQFVEAWRRQDHQAAFQYAQRMGYPLAGRLDQPARLYRAVWSGYLYQNFARYFSLIFWFMLAGAGGALMVRLVSQLAQAGGNRELRHEARRLDYLLQWLPARLLVLTFALVGNFPECLRRAKRTLAASPVTVRGLLVEAAEGALSGSLAPAGAEGDAQRVLELRGLLSRSVLVWFAILAALVLLGWL